ncbi:RNA polymerase recycling motor HelD [Virgibacillus sp. 6R]|uniref:RNA polymerase recycling motor HelD n=1 Tax=Metabacillus sp. 22489 TaxID=3453928 RepID=UPI00119C93AC
MDSNFQQEQKRVTDVMEVIEKRISSLVEETTQRRNEVVQIRKHFNDEIKVNMDTFDDFLETIIGLRQEAQALSVSQSTHRHASKRLSTLRRMQEVPYFGRIDFIEDGMPTKEQIYIGISTLTDESGDNFLIYDWRSPIASVYYDYQPGPAKYASPEGEIEGIIERKWQYLIRDGILQSMFDTSITIGDEILQEVLGKGNDKHMHNIVATIQQEQNRIIRHDRGKLLIVHGAAGSGKTSAALQRIAYLLYKYRGNLNPEQIILFSPNTMFNKYVSNVLPELGEENMQQVTFQEYLDHRLSKEFHVENPYEQLEYVLTAKNTLSYHSRVASIQFKASTRFFKVIEKYRKSLELSGMLFNSIKFRGKPIVTAEQIAERFYHNDTTLRFPNRLEKLKDWLIKKLNDAEKVEWKKPWVQEEIELLSEDDYRKAYTYLAKKRGFKRESIADYEMETKALARLIVHQKLKPLRKQIMAFKFVDLKGIYKQLFSDSIQIKQLIDGEIPEGLAEICQLTLEMLDEGNLFYEDATPFLLIKELIQGFQTNSSIKHVLVDEAQDYSPFQFEFLKRLFPLARMTVLGDFNQAIFSHAREMDDFHTVMSIFGKDDTEVMNMTRSYRSTKPIIEFTRKLIPNGERIIPFERVSERPVLTRVNNHTELHQYITSKVTTLRSLRYNSIAIICKSAEESKHAFEALSNIKDIKLLTNSSIEYEQGVVVIPSYLSKGIEFDAVIIYDASEQVYGDESLRRLFYTACTRAMHYLQLYSIGKPTPLLKNVLRDSFTES